jgi:hypothetical protein
MQEGINASYKSDQYVRKEESLIHGYQEGINICRWVVRKDKGEQSY